MKIRTAAAAAVVTVSLAGCGPIDTLTQRPSPTAPSAGQPATAGSSSTGGASSSHKATRPPATSSSVDAGRYRAARSELAHLPVKGRAPMTGYDRDQFGQRWADTDRNGCDQRNDALRRGMTDLVIKAGTHGCKVLSGVLHDPYTGATIHFQFGVRTSSKVQIDHLVSLSDSWQTGAQQLSPEQREQLANDPANLLAVDGPTNESKGDGDAATWLPPNKAYRCTYVTAQVTVKTRYHLWVTPAEKAAIARVLDHC